MTRTTYLERHITGLSSASPHSVRIWLMKRIEEEIRARGQPIPRLILIGDGFMETLDLTELLTADPDASPGATFQALRNRPGILQRFALIQVSPASAPDQKHAFVFEEIDGAGRRSWWSASVQYRTDPDTGFGRFEPPWAIAAQVDDPSILAPILQELTSPPPGSRSGNWAPPRSMLDVKRIWGDLPPQSATPTTALDLVQLALAIAAKPILKGQVRGSVVIKLIGRHWQGFALQGPMPADLDGMMRLLCAHEARADAIAVVQAVIRPEDDPPVPGLQVFAELGGALCEGWVPVIRSEASGEPERLGTLKHRGLQFPPGGQWLGVPGPEGIELTEANAIPEA